MNGPQEKAPLLTALAIASVLAAAASLVLYLNEDLRRTTFGVIEEVKNDEGEIVKRLKSEKPSPRPEQVREIARHQENKKRESLKENARKLKKVVFELEEAAAVRKASLQHPDTWDHFARLSASIRQEAALTHFRIRINSRFFNAQEGASEITAKSNSEAEQHAGLMRVLSTQEEVKNQDAWDALEDARQLLATILSTRDFTLATQDLAAKTQEQKERERLFRELKTPIDHVNALYLQTESYLESFENFMLKKEIPPAIAENAPPNSQGEPEPPSAPLPSEEDLENMKTAELYEQIQELTERANEAYAENKAAELAERQQLDLDEAKKLTYPETTNTGPDLSEALSQNTPEDAEAFSEFNEALENAVRASTRMANQAEHKHNKSLGKKTSSRESGTELAETLRKNLNQDSVLKAKMAQNAKNAGRSKGNLQDMRHLMEQNYSIGSELTQKPGETSGSNGGQGSGGDFNADSLGQHDEASSNPNQISLPLRETLAQALPGRRFDMDSNRKGWIFIDTWYVIGPWQLPRFNSFDTIFPPETDIDLDATYPGKTYNGQTLELKWRFVQTEGLRIKPPDETSGSVYYAYTEVYSEKPLDVVVAVASDDRSKFWINDMVVFEDSGLSGWELDEGFRRVLLKQGYNKLLVRLENGPSITHFSVLFCPIDALN